MEMDSFCDKILPQTSKQTIRIHILTHTHTHCRTVRLNAKIVQMEFDLKTDASNVLVVKLW